MEDGIVANPAERPVLQRLSFIDWMRRLARELALQDWLVGAYVVVLVVAVAGFGDPSEAKSQNLTRLLSLLAVYVVGISSVRGGLVTNGFASSLLYRMTIFWVMQVSYLMLRGLLPVVNAGALDGFLYRLDLNLFGVEPSLWMDQFVTPRTTEWFSFFYFGYFFLLAVHVLPLLFLSRRTKLFAEFSLAFLLLYCTAHIIYMLVPGYGPYRFLATEFRHPLVGGFWLERVLEAVNTAGAQKDIFPSLHTGGPTMVFLFSLRHRRLMPFKYTWPITGIFAANIIIATMFLRWHYLIDIFAGLALASASVAVAAVVSKWEHTRREADGLQPVWSALLPERSKTENVPTARHSVT